MTQYYNLDGYLVFESPDGEGWVEWVEDEVGGLICLVGDLIIDDKINVTILSEVKNKTGESRFKTLNETSEYVLSLPRWKKTKYYSKKTNLGTSGLVECKSGEVVDPGFEYKLDPNLVIKYNNRENQQTCAICGKKVELKIPLALFLYDRSASTVFRAVCEKCGNKYAPILVNLIDQFYSENGFSPEFQIVE